MKRCAWLVVFLLLVACFAASALSESLPTLSYGSTGQPVWTLQERLTELGYYSFRITGNYQENTQKAVREFQADNSLAVTGTADDALQQMILSADARPKPTPTPSPTPVPMDMAVPFTQKLEFGAKNEDVRRVQTRLAELGYYEINISGEYLGNTRNAVRDFQRQNGLRVDGVIGEETWQWLFFEEGVVDVHATPRPSPSPTPVPYRIGVDITNQVTTVYALGENEDYTEVVKHMLCSTGTQSDPTPPGTYVLNGAKSRWCYFPKWGTHGQYWTRIDAYNAFHSVIYSEADPMALKTGSYTGLGKRASHGCIRLMVADAKWLYDNITKGTEVIIFEGEQDEELTKSLKIPPLDYSNMLPKPTPAPTEPPVYSPHAEPPTPYRTLQRGTESDDVYWLQCRLAELGYYNGTITGGYYAGTAEAVKAFQRDYDLSADGKAGKNTLTLLYSEAVATPTPLPTATPWIAPTPSLTPEPTPGPTAIPTPMPGGRGETWFELP